MKSEQIKNQLKELIKRINYNPIDYAPHHQIKREVEAIEQKLIELVTELENEGRNKIQIHGFANMIAALHHTMKREYIYCDTSHKKMNKNNSAKKRATE